MTNNFRVGDTCIYNSGKDHGGNPNRHGEQCVILEVRSEDWTYIYVVEWQDGMHEPVKKESLTRIKSTKEMETQQPTTTTISVSDLKKIHNVACSTWKLKIEKMVKPFEDTVTLTEEQIGKMFDAANYSQAKLLEQIFGERFTNGLFDFGYEHMITTKIFEGPMHIREVYATTGNSHREVGFNQMYTPVIVIDGKETELKTGEHGAYIKFKTK